MTSPAPDSKWQFVPFDRPLDLTVEGVVVTGVWVNTGESGATRPPADHGETEEADDCPVCGAEISYG